MDDLAIHEFAALRATIQSRGGTRILSFLAGICAWAVTLTAVLAWLPSPMASLVPLVLLLTTFEVVRVQHLVVERIGRYVQVFYEEAGSGADALRPPTWERAAMHFGPATPGAGGHPLFLPVFAVAVLANSLAIIFPGPIAVEAGTLAVPHVAFVAWMLYCDRGMRRQRAADLERYRALKAQHL
jgi:hypothetical protein